MKLYGAETVIRRAEIGLELAGEDAVAWPADTETVGAHLGQPQPGPPGRRPRRRLQRDPAQHHQRAAARDAPGGRGRPRHRLPGRPPQRQSLDTRVHPNPRGAPTMTTFNAFVLTKDDDGQQHLDWTSVDESDLMDGDVTVDVSHSTMNYKDGLALTGCVARGAALADDPRDRLRGDGVRLVPRGHRRRATPSSSTGGASARPTSAGSPSGPGCPASGWCRCPRRSPRRSRWPSAPPATPRRCACWPSSATASRPTTGPSWSRAPAAAWAAWPSPSWPPPGSRSSPRPARPTRPGT